MKMLSLLTAIAVIASMTFANSTVQAQNVIVADDFEGADFSPDWGSVNRATITSTGPGSGAVGTDNFVTITSDGPITPETSANASLGGLVVGVTDISVDFYVQIQDSTARQFNFQMGRTAVINNSNPALNIRFEDGNWDTFSSGAWNQIDGLTALTPGEWHRVRISGNSFGSADPAPSYDIEVSAAGETTFNSSATGLTLFVNLAPTTLDATTSFNFNARFGDNPGFNVDEVTATTTSDITPDLVGDFEPDGDVDIDDIDFYVGNIGAAADGDLAQLDLNGDGQITEVDLQIHIETHVQTSNGQTGTFLGDFNLDGVVNVLGDAFILVANLNGAATSYAQGDVNLDGVVDVLGDAFALVGNLGMSNDQ